MQYILNLALHLLTERESTVHSVPVSVTEFKALTSLNICLVSFIWVLFSKTKTKNKQGVLD